MQFGETFDVLAPLVTVNTVKFKRDIFKVVSLNTGVVIAITYDNNNLQQWSIRQIRAVSL